MPTDPNPKIQQIVRYYTDCFRADNREIYLSDFLGTKVQFRYFFSEKEELINGALPYCPIDHVSGEELHKQVLLTQKEKQLTHASCFLAYPNPFKSESKPMNVAPLMMHPARIMEKDGAYFAEISFEERIINMDVLNLFPKINGEEMVQQIQQKIGFEPLDFGQLGTLARLIEGVEPAINTEALLMYPALMNQRALRRMVKKLGTQADKSYTFLNASALGLIPKSQRSGGIIYELDQIAEKADFSPPIRRLFGFETESIAEETPFNVTPTLLNNAQQEILSQANKHLVSVVIGPPGTGKSFTIAALAINQMSQGKSVLIAAHTENAVNVLAEKVDEHLGLPNIAVQGGNHSRQNALKKHLQYVLGRMFRPKVSEKQLRQCEYDVIRGIKDLEELNELMQAATANEIYKATSLLDDAGIKRFFYGSPKRYLKHRAKHSQPIWELVHRLQDTTEHFLKASRTYLEQGYLHNLAEVIREHRFSLRLFQKALQARLHTKRQQYFQEAGKTPVLKAFPIWLTTTSYVDRILPLEKEMFDLVVIDEATQCSIPEVLPLLQRAKRAVLVGDPQQLRFISFLSRNREHHLQEQHGVDEFRYRDYSVLDQAEETITDYHAVNFLNEHFRSVPPIIHFSNQQFYHQQLEVLSKRPLQNYLNALRMTRCPGSHQNGYNKPEAEQVLEAVKVLIESQKEWPKEICFSIGLLSPFRAQADHLKKLLDKQLSMGLLQRHRILVGTAHAFQGEERDVMFLSLSLDEKTHPTAYRFINRADVFNVMVTRAKRQQEVFYSFEPENLPDDTLLKAYLLNDHHEPPPEAQQFEKDQFGMSVTEVLEGKGIKHWPLFKLGAQDIDLLTQVNGRLVAVDLIGYPGDLQGTFPFERYKMLNRIGIRVFPLPYTFWQGDPEMCLEALHTFAS